MSSKLKTVIDGMKSDKYTLISRNDPLILKLGEYYVSKAGHTNNSNHYISQKMREVSRLLDEARSFNSCIQTAKDLIDAVNFDSLVYMQPAVLLPLMTKHQHTSVHH